MNVTNSNKHVDILTQLLVYSSCTSEAQLIDYILSRVELCISVPPHIHTTR